MPRKYHGVLTLGHVAEQQHSDSLAHGGARMRGVEVRWLPCMDHAELNPTAVEKWLRQNEGVTRHYLGSREIFAASCSNGRTNKPASHSNNSSDRCSCAGPVSAYNFDDNYVARSEKIFVDLYKKKLTIAAAHDSLVPGRANRFRTRSH